ncbi:MAG: hypothetical protein HKN26_03895 [Acidimicrobiales bacterium]|nr:hypothetical protein [Acidimicrobiales bacterium]
MSWALIEILVPLLVALAVGALASWFVFRWRRPVVTAEQWNAMAEDAASAQSASEAAEVQIGELEAEITALRHARDALQEQLDSEPSAKQLKRSAKTAESTPAETVPADTVAQIETLQRDLARARAKVDELKAARRQIAELEDELAAGRQVTADLAAAQLRIRAYERELARGGSAAPVKPEAANRPELDIAPAAHADDLKIVNGIGPKIERMLHGSGITAWEQLAELSESDVDRLEHDLGLSGRIGRDRWVSQANELIQRYPDPAERPNQ